MLFSKSKNMQRLIDSLELISTSDVNVLLTGESGTGKEVLAKRIHALSSRSTRPFIAINCAAIPENLLESELFGHKKGSFTGANVDHKGLFELAHQGTVFLDEIGDMAYSLQAKILRVLQEKKIRPVGGSAERAVDIKVISATHRNLKEEIAKGRFREDLFYRLGVIPVHVPPLRQRLEDIPDLVLHFSSRFSEKYDTGRLEFSSEALEALCKRPWPGNIRELENLVEFISVMSRGKRTIEVDDIPIDSSNPDCGSEISWNFKLPKTLPNMDDLKEQYMRHVLSQVNWNQCEAAKVLGISRRTIHRKLRLLT